MNVCGYVRVSTSEQATDDHYSIPEQIDRLKAYCLSREWNLVKIYTDPGYSGKSLDRPAMQSLMQECKLYDLVLVNKLDRLSRSQKDTLYLIEDVFRKQGVQFASISENFDTSTSVGMAMVGILSVFAQFEREQIRERMHMGRVGRVKKGKWHTTGKPPIGYDYVDGELIVNNSEAEQIRLIFRKFLAGESFHAISAYMHEHYVNKYSSWAHPSGIRDVILDPVYIGKVRFDGEFYDGLHAPIIDRDTFDKAQERYERISRSSNPHHQNPFKSSYMLSGIIFCGECGSRYTVAASHAKNAKRSYVYYGCRGRHGTAKERAACKCKNRYFRVDDLDNAIIQEILKLDFADVKQEVVQEPDNSKEIAKIDKQISRLLDLYSVDGIDFDTVKEKVAALNKKKEKLSTLKKVKKPKKATQTIYIQAKDVLETGTLEQKRQIVAALIKEIILYPDHIKIRWNL